MNANNVDTDKYIMEFMETWTVDTAKSKDFFMQCYELIKNLANANYEFISRPSITYSLRASIINGEKPLFVMIDIIDDEPDNRWISMCFFANSINVDYGMGDLVPKGLFNEDALCFDVENEDKEFHLYLLAKIKEAYENSNK